MGIMLLGSCLGTFDHLLKSKLSDLHSACPRSTFQTLKPGKMKPSLYNISQCRFRECKHEFPVLPLIPNMLQCVRVMLVAGWFMARKNLVNV